MTHACVLLLLCVLGVRLCGGVFRPERQQDDDLFRYATGS